MSATPAETASNTSNGFTSSPAAKTCTLRRPPVSAVIERPNLSALVPTPGKPFGQLVTIFNSRTPCAIAGVATVAAAATTVPLRVKNLRRSIALFPSRRRSPPTPRGLQHIEPAAMSQLPCAVAHRPAAVSFGSFTSFPLSRRVRFAPRADIRPAAGTQVIYPARSSGSGHNVDFELTQECAQIARHYGGADSSRLNCSVELFEHGTGHQICRWRQAAPTRCYEAELTKHRWSLDRPKDQLSVRGGGNSD